MCPIARAASPPTHKKELCSFPPNHFFAFASLVFPISLHQHRCERSVEARKRETRWRILTDRVKEEHFRLRTARKIREHARCCLQSSAIAHEGDRGWISPKSATFNVTTREKEQGFHFFCLGGEGHSGWRQHSGWRLRSMRTSRKPPHSC